MKLKVAAAQMRIVDGNVDENLAEAERLIAQAATSGADVVCLPEMWPTGFDYPYLLKAAEPLSGRFREFLSHQAGEKGIFLVGGSMPERDGERVYNTATVFGTDGSLITSYRKIHLFTLMNEHSYLAGGEDACTFPLGGITAGLFICYDVRFPELMRSLVTGGAGIFFHPAEFPHPRLHHWRTLIQARAIENQVWMVSTNRAGKGGENVFFGHSMIVDPWGDVVAEGGEDPGLVIAEIDTDMIALVRKSLSALDDIRSDLFTLECHSRSSR